MTLQIGTDFLYIPKIGMPSMQGVSFGFLAITNKNIFYIPQMVQDMTSYGPYEYMQMDVKKYDKIDFWDVVPSLCRDLAQVSQLDEFLSAMASKITGSIRVALNDVTTFKIGFFASFTIVTAAKKYRLSVGGKRKDIQQYLQDKCLLR